MEKRVINSHFIPSQHRRQEPGRDKVSGEVLIHSSWAWLGSYILWPNLQFIVSNCFNFVVNLMPIFLNLPISNKRNRCLFLQSTYVNENEIVNVHPDKAF